MGAAVPVIALAVSAVGTAASVASQASGGGGTIYSPDSKAKYQADLEALKLNEYTAKQKQALIDQEKIAAQDFAKFAHEQQIIQLNTESTNAALQLEQQWQQLNYNRGISQQTQAMEKFISNASLESYRQQAENEYASTKRSLGLDKQARQAELGFGEAGRKLREQSLQGQQLGIEQQGLGLDITQARQDQQNLEAQQALNAQENQLGLQEQGQNQAAFEQSQKLSSAESQNQAQLNLSLAQADEAKRKQLNQLLLTFSGNEQDYAKYQARLASMGLTSSGATQYDLNNNLQTQLAQAEALSGASNAKTQAGVDNQYAQSQVQQGRASLASQQGLNKQALDLAKGQLGQNRSNLASNQALGNQAIGLQRQGLRLSQADSMLAKYQLDLDREYDVFSKGLLPDLRSQQIINEADQKRLQSLFGVNLQQVGEDFGRNVQSSVEDRQYQLDQQAYQSGLESIPSNYAYQRKAADANYLSSLGSSNTQQEAALAALASSQYGLLSSIGQGLANGTTTGQVGGGNWASGLANSLDSIGGFMGSLQGYLSTRNVPTQTQQPRSTLYSGTTGLNTLG